MPQRNIAGAESPIRSPETSDSAIAENSVVQARVEDAYQRTFGHDLDGPLQSLKSSTIMMVDDEPTTLDVLRMFLQGEGYGRVQKTNNLA